MKINWAIQSKLTCYYIGSTDIKDIKGITVSSCYLAYNNVKENSEYFRGRSKMVLSVYDNKFFIRMLKYV